MASDSNAEQRGGGGGEGEDRDGRRFPPTMEGLLRFSIEHTSDQADSASLQPQEMTEERRQFLRSALAEATVDPIQVIKRSLAEMQELLDREERQEEEEEGEGDGEEAASQRLQALLENVTDWCNDIDLANDLHKIGGFALFPRLLAAKAAGVRSRAAELVATVAQNNPYTQAQLLAQGALPTLLRLTDDEAAGDEVRVKALFAISCMVRNNAEAAAEFSRGGGHAVLLRAMQTRVDKLRVKAAFLLASLCADDDAVKDTLCDMGMPEQLAGLLRAEHDPTHEHLTSALLALVTDHARAAAECQREELGLRRLLEARVKELAGREECQEEVEYCKTILQICFQGGNNSSSQQGPDR